MIKIAHICTSRSMYKLLEDKLILLKKKGYDIDIVSSKDDSETDVFNKQGITQKYIYMNKKIRLIDDIKSIVNMVRFLKKEKYTIVHTHNAKAGIIGRIAAKIAGVPIIIHTTHGLPFYEGQNKLIYNIYKTLELFGLKISNYLCSQNQQDLDLMSKYVSSKKLYYEGNGVDIDKLQNIYNSISECDLEEIREKLNIPKDYIILLMGARFEPVKNHNLLLNALKVLKERNISNFIVLLAGKGPLEDEIKERTVELGLESNIRFLGYKKDIYKYIKLSDIVVLSSEKEGIPRILMESMFFYKPIVATNVLGTKELVLNNETGLLSEVNDVIGLANNIEKLFRDENLRVNLGNNARIRIENNFTEQIVVERIDKLYLKVLNDKIYKKNNKNELLV